MNGRGVKVRPARPGVKPSNRQLKTSVGDKVSMFADRHCSAGIEARGRGLETVSHGLLLSTAVPQLSVLTDGDAERHHPSLRALH